jgi:predicted DNA-binding protein
MIKEVYFMATQKIAITVPPLFLKRLDQWAKKRGKTRSRFIVEELDNRLKTLEDEEITKLYNEVCADKDTSNYDKDLAEDMLGLSSVQEEEEKW